MTRTLWSTLYVGGANCGCQVQKLRVDLQVREVNDRTRIAPLSSERFKKRGVVKVLERERDLRRPASEESAQIQRKETWRSVGISPTVFSKLLLNSGKIGDRISALKYVLRPSLRCCNMPLRSGELSARCRLDGRVWRNSANSDRYHHFAGRVRVAASTPCRTLGKRLSSADVFLRIMHILLRSLDAKYAGHTRTQD